jgi:ribonuclease D
MDIQLLRDDLSVEFLGAALAAGRVAVDIETTGLDWRTDAIGTVQVCVPDTGIAVVQVGPSVPERLRELMGLIRVQKVLHHAPFDLRFMVHLWQATPRNIACTKVASRVLHPRWHDKDHSLAALLARYLSVRLDKGNVRTSDWTAAALTEDQLRYAARDVEHLPALLALLMTEAVDTGVADLVEASFQYLPVRVDTDLRGCEDVFAY